MLPVFQRVFADIGDEQSIAANLSTFSAHLAAIVEMTRDLAAPGAGPAGRGRRRHRSHGRRRAGVAVVDHFRRRGAMVVATTHHGLMKAYAQSTAGVACASFGYDPHTYEPTYRLALGVPGRAWRWRWPSGSGLPAASCRTRGRGATRRKPRPKRCSSSSRRPGRARAASAGTGPNSVEVEAPWPRRRKDEERWTGEEARRARGVRARAEAARRGGGAPGHGGGPPRPCSRSRRRPGAEAAAAQARRTAGRRHPRGAAERLWRPGAPASRSRRCRRSRSRGRSACA